MNIKYISIPLFTLNLFFSFSVTADSWPAAKVKGIINPEGSVVVKIYPGDSLGDLVGYENSKKGQYAKASFFRWNGTDGFKQYQKIQLLNPISPVDAFISDDGTLVTLDNWHNSGYGEIVVIYKPDGTILQQYQLLDLYGSDEVQINQISRSSSSLWWRCYDSAPELYNHTLEVHDSFGFTFKFDLQTGLFNYEETFDGCDNKD